MQHSKDYDVLIEGLGTYRPSCYDFTDGGVSSANFSWSELNGGWAGGNESIHRPWGMVDSNLPYNLEALRSLATNAPDLVGYRNDKGEVPLNVTSGYRCPIGNKASGGVSGSRHMVGKAADIGTSQIKEYHDALEELARDMTPKPRYVSKWETYPDDRHLHIDWN